MRGLRFKEYFRTISYCKCKHRDRLNTLFVFVFCATNVIFISTIFRIFKYFLLLGKSGIKYNELPLKFIDRKLFLILQWIYFHCFSKFYNNYLFFRQISQYSDFKHWTGNLLIFWCIIQENSHELNLFVSMLFLS